MDQMSPDRLEQFEEIIARQLEKRLHETLGYKCFPNSYASKLIDFKFMKTDNASAENGTLRIIDQAFAQLPSPQDPSVWRAWKLAKAGPELAQWVTAIYESRGYNSTAAEELLRRLGLICGQKASGPYDEVAALKLALSEQKRRADEFERRWNEIRIRAGVPADGTIKEVYEHLFPDWIYNKAQPEPHPQYDFSDLTEEQKAAVDDARNRGYTRIRKCLQALADGRTVLIADLAGKTVNVPIVSRS